MRAVTSEEYRQFWALIQEYATARALCERARVTGDREQREIQAIRTEAARVALDAALPIDWMRAEVSP